MFVRVRKVPTPFIPQCVCWFLSHSLSLTLRVCEWESGIVCVYSCHSLSHTHIPHRFSWWVLSTYQVSFAKEPYVFCCIAHWEISGAHHTLSPSLPPKTIGLFCKRALLKSLYSAKETYHAHPHSLSLPSSLSLSCSLTLSHTHTYLIARTILTHLTSPIRLNYRSLLQNIVSFIGLFCRRDLWLNRP